MTNRKKKRRRSRPSGGASGNGTRGGAQIRPAAGDAPEAGEGSSQEAPARPRGAFGARLREASPYPGFADTMARGLGAAGSSFSSMVIAFLAVLGLWAGYVLIGAVDLMSPKAMANLLALPPIHILFGETNLAFSPVPAASPPVKLALAVGFTMARGLVLGAIIALLAARLAWREERPLRRWLRAVPQLLLISLAFFGVAAAVPFLVLSLLPGQLGTIVVLAGPIVGLHFLAFAPVAAVLDGSSYRAAIRRSARAARLPGGSHLALTFGYFAFALFLVSAVPQPIVAPATPSTSTWAIALGATFLHVAVLGAFVYRWLAVRDLVSADVAPRAARERGLLGRLSG